MSYDLIVVCLVLILLKEGGSPRKSDLGNILLNLIGIHSETGINELDGLFLRVYNYSDLILKIIGVSIFSDHIQLFKLGYGIAAV